MSIEEVIQNKGLIRGFLKPIFYDEWGRSSALTTEDFRKVRDGYACAKCLAEYVTYLVRCPVCGAQRNVEADLIAPDPLEAAHLLERDRTEGMDTGAPRGFDEFMEGVNANPDIDHVPLSKLKPRRRR